MSSKQERATRPASGQEEEATPDSEQTNTSAASAAEASSNAADAVDAIDDVLEEFDNVMLDELGLREKEVLDPAEVDEAIQRKLAEYVQRGGQ
ncbi:hypothetical protein [Streptomyces sp. NPDC059850]|uniref:hypothetical protein n=1 Tax=Streptomyces sp. NPDC059850 TaxID=3346970 RepID=UPI0036545BF6